MALKLEKTPMRELDPQERRHHFKEVALGYTLKRQSRKQSGAYSAKSPCVSQAAL